MPTEPTGGVITLLRSVADQARGLARDDLAGELEACEQTLRAGPFPVTVIGAPGKGRSALVNAIVAAPVCGVSALRSTAVPSIVCHGDSAVALLLRQGTPGTPIPADRAPRYALSGTDDEGRPITAVEVHLPRQVLGSGLVLVDTPGVGGGFAAASAAATLRGVTHSAAVLFVTDAAQEMSAAELDLLRRAVEVCATAAVVVTKIDLYPHWRHVVALNTDLVHAIDADLPVIPVSATLRELALATGDPSLEAECGCGMLVSLLDGPLRQRRRTAQTRDAAASAAEVLHQLAEQLTAERVPLADPSHEAEYLADLSAQVTRAEQRMRAATDWRELLADEIRAMRRAVATDLTKWVRDLEQAATERIESGDPVRAWVDFQGWVQARANAGLAAHHEYLLRRVDAVIATMSGVLAAELIGTGSAGTGLARPGLIAGSPERLTARPMSAIDLGMYAARGLSLSGYVSLIAGTLVFSALGIPAIAVTLPLTGVLGATFAGRTVLGARQAQLRAARAEALTAVRAWLSQLIADTARSDEELQDQVYRNLRTHVAEAAQRSHADARAQLDAAGSASRLEGSRRQQRLAEVDSRLGVLRHVEATVRDALESGRRGRHATVGGAPGEPAGGTAGTAAGTAAGRPAPGAGQGRS